MSGLFDSALGSKIGAADTAIYTAEVDGVVMSILLTNSHFGTLPVKVWISRGGVAESIFADRIKSGESAPATRGDKVAVSVGDIIYASCPVADVISFAISVYKDS